MTNLLKIVAVGIAIIFFMFCSSTSEDEGAVTPAQRKNIPDQESWKSTILITRNGRKVAEVWAGYLAYYQKQAHTILKDSIHVDFYDSHGNHNSVLTAREGEVFNRTSDLIARGNVVVVSDSGVVLRTEELRWDNQRQKIVSDKKVFFTTERDTLVGDAFISDPDLKHYEIRNPRGYSRRAVPIKK